VAAAPRSLVDSFDARRNNLAVQRLALASVVLLVHGHALSQGHQPTVFRADLGELAVDGFFVLSGLLVTRSALRLGSVRRFVWHRTLRVLPGFWVCLLFTAGIAAPLLIWVEDRPFTALWRGPDPLLGYVARNAALMIRQPGVGGALADAHAGGTVNGSLWSLYYEAACYLAVAGLMVVGVLASRRLPSGRHDASPGRTVVPRRWMVVGITGAIWLTLVADEAGAALPLHLGRRMGFTFLLGVLSWLFAESIPMDGRLALLSVPLMLGSCALLYEYRLLGGVPFAYAMVWLAVAAPVVPQPSFDVSYGVYMYHWPVFALLGELGLGGAGPLVFLSCGTAVALGLAAASWFGMESRALRYKDARWVGGRRRAVEAVPTPGRTGQPADDSRDGAPIRVC